MVEHQSVDDNPVERALILMNKKEFDVLYAAFERAKKKRGEL